MDEILQAHAVLLNIHYQDVSLLEVPRIYESLSHGLKILSEDSLDSKLYKDLNNQEFISFVPTGDIEAMRSELTKLLQIDFNTEETKKVLEVASAEYQFSMDRLLLALGILELDSFHHLGSPLEILPSEVVISMPETFDRREAFLNNYKDYQIDFFPGLRFGIPWIGCGLSYKYLAKRAIDSNARMQIIMEDDVVLPSDYPQVRGDILEYLSSRKSGWDVFTGLIADLPSDARILDVEEYRGKTFVTLSKMTGMVWSVYSRDMLRYIQAWNPYNQNAETNTIDRYLNGKSDLRVVVSLPFEFQHRSNLKSTLWNIENTRYDKMISETGKKLDFMVKDFKINNDI